MLGLVSNFHFGEPISSSMRLRTRLVKSVSERNSQILPGCSARSAQRERFPTSELPLAASNVPARTAAQLPVRSSVLRGLSTATAIPATFVGLKIWTERFVFNFLPMVKSDTCVPSIPMSIMGHTLAKDKRFVTFLLREMVVQDCSLQNPSSSQIQQSQIRPLQVSRTVITPSQISVVEELDRPLLRKQETLPKSQPTAIARIFKILPRSCPLSARAIPIHLRLLPLPISHLLRSTATLNEARSDSRRLRSSTTPSPTRNLLGRSSIQHRLVQTTSVFRNVFSSRVVATTPTPSGERSVLAAETQTRMRCRMTRLCTSAVLLVSITLSVRTGARSTQLVTSFRD